MKRKGNISMGIIKGISKAEKKWKGISNTTGSLNSQCLSREHRERVKEILAAQEKRK